MIYFNLIDMNYKVRFTKSTSNKIADTLHLEGCLTIHQIEAIKQEIEAELNTGKTLQLKVQHVEQLDVAFLQLLMVLRNKYQQLGQSIIIEMNLSQDMERLLIVSGFKNFVTANFK